MSAFAQSGAEFAAWTRLWMTRRFSAWTAHYVHVEQLHALVGSPEGASRRRCVCAPPYAARVFFCLWCFVYACACATKHTCSSAPHLRLLTLSRFAQWHTAFDARLVRAASGWRRAAADSRVCARAQP